ncbi:alpha/beta hydrolase [Aquibacillus saliphilus]|uniref:alpha/beta hydrolase n=1 Tax=Aquibacillus saliphilus TaxID=1909422 RepID=UPI0021028866|nr:alpha/beta hydrolase [Aquibacillus saliphilus]
MNFLDKVLDELREPLKLLPIVKLPEDLQTARQTPIPPDGQSETVRITNRYISGGDGQEMLIKIYEPIHKDNKPLPAVLWSHGGGYVLGHPNSDDRLCESFVEKGKCIVVSADYRLAPEHPYPAAVEDCYSALKWMTDNYKIFNIDLKRVAITGGSAGGGITASLALLARDRGGPNICFQMPLYPMIDNRNITSSSQEITDNHAVWFKSNNIAAWKMYLGEIENEDIPQYAAPTRADNLEGLPPTYTCVGQLDPFRDETIDYVARLARAGVEVEFKLYPGCFHAFEHIAPDAEISKQAKEEYIKALAKAFQT